MPGSGDVARRRVVRVACTGRLAKRDLGYSDEDARIGGAADRSGPRADGAEVRADDVGAVPVVAGADRGLDKLAGVEAVFVARAFVDVSVLAADLDVVGAATVEDRLPRPERHAGRASIADFHEPDAGPHVTHLGLRNRHVTHLRAARSERVSG